MSRLTLVALLLLATRVSLAQIPLNGSIEDLKNVCDVEANDKELRVINATALLVANDPQFITHNADGTYTINTVALVYDYDLNLPLCGGSYLFGEPHVPQQSGRSGFLIDSNKIMTAAHGVTGTTQGEFNPLHFLVVFRPSMISAGEGCSNFTWTNIPASDVYMPNGIVDTNTFSVSPTTRYDYAVFELTQPVTDRLPLKIRRSGRAHVGDTLFSAGYPERGGEKADTAGIMAVVDAQSSITNGFRASYLGDDIAYNLHDFYGSSGSPVYNEQADVVEFVVAHGPSNWFTDTDGPCVYAAELEPTDDTQSLGPTSTNGPTPDIQDLVPRPEVLVAPSEYVDHILDLHDPNSTSTSPYSVTTARYDGSGNPIGGELIDVEQTSWPADPGDPNVSLSIAPGFYNVPAGGMNFEINTDISNVNTCGTWDYDLDVLDVTNSQDNIIRHHFEIGLREYALTPADDWTVNDLGPPYQQSKTYTLQNVRPTPTHVLVSQDGTLPNSNLILINGVATAAFDLGAAGTATDHASFTLTIDPSVASQTAVGTQYQGRVAIYNQPFNCSVPSESWYIYRYVTFKRGEQLFASTPPGGFANAPSPGEEYGTPLRFDFDLTGETIAECLADLNLYLGVPNPLGHTSLDVVAPTLQIAITAPSGLQRTLWLGNSLTGSNYEATVYDASDNPITALFLDDQSAPPLGPYLLGAFGGQPLKGHWYMDVSTSGGGIVLGPAQLDFTRSICTSGGK